MTPKQAVEYWVRVEVRVMAGRARARRYGDLFVQIDAKRLASAA